VLEEKQYLLQSNQRKQISHRTRSEKFRLLLTRAKVWFQYLLLDGKSHAKGQGKRPRKENIDIPDLKDDYVEVPGTPPITHTETGIICQAGLSCHLQDITIVLEGNATNGSLCCKCEDNFHFFLFVSV
jgi:hypothetical protein